MGSASLKELSNSEAPKAQGKANPFWEDGCSSINRAHPVALFELLKGSVDGPSSITPHHTALLELLKCDPSNHRHHLTLLRSPLQVPVGIHCKSPHMDVSTPISAHQEIDLDISNKRVTKSESESQVKLPGTTTLPAVNTPDLDPTTTKTTTTTKNTATKTSDTTKTTAMNSTLTDTLTSNTTVTTTVSNTTAYGNRATVSVSACGDVV